MNRYTLAALLAASLFLVACEKEGPMEKAGKQLDSAADNIGDAFKTDRGAAEKAGEKIDETIEKVQSGME